MKVISCVEAVKRIFELLEGNLGGPQRSGLDEHILECRECCDRLEFEKLLKEKMKELGNAEEAPKTLTKRIEKLLREF